jgi:hypothetical protein
MLANVVQATRFSTRVNCAIKLFLLVVFRQTDHPANIGPSIAAANAL